MRAELQVFDRLPEEPERLAWCEWLTRHGIDPSDVVIPGAVWRYPGEYRVYYRSLVRDSDGHPVWDDGGPREERRFVQLEGPPLPFPARGPKPNDPLERS